MTLTNLAALDVFHFNDTNLCEPVEEAFQAWLRDISDVQSTGCTNVATEDAAPVPAEFTVHQNYPNPFNPRTTIRYEVPQPDPVKLVVYDMLGRQVRVLVDGVVAAGIHEVRFDAGLLPSGVYGYRLDTPAGSFTRTMHLLR